jgi:hypothetical protein
MKRFPSKYWKIGATVIFGLVVYCFWRYRYPFALTYQEQFQLFLFDNDYFIERIGEPGGLARYIGEFLTQFYNSPTLGAAILAVALMLMQRLTWRLMRCEGHYFTSFLPSILLWYAMGDENILLTYTVALLIALMVCWVSAKAFLSWGYERKMLLRRLYVMLVLIPLLYWLIGPMVLMPTIVLMPASSVYALAVMAVSAHNLPFPMMRVMTGISYYRSPEIIIALLVIIPVVTIVVINFVRLLPKERRTVILAEAFVVAVGIVSIFMGCGFDQKKYELMEYDQLVRVKDWDGIIAKAEQQTPDLPMSVCATNLALAMTNQLGEHAFDFYQHGNEGLLPTFERNYATTLLKGEVYFFLGLVNTSQRLAFEAMEAIPNYNKSGRAVKRLAETNLINGQYEVARKYLRMLEKTVFYRPWAQRALAILGNEEQIEAHPLYGTLRQYRLEDDFLFSEDELDKVCGQLFWHNHKNQMAAQYLLMAPLLDKDVPRFMQYAQYVQSEKQYNPRHCQEAIAFAFMQKGQQPPQGVVSQLILQQMSDFTRIWSANSSSPELGRYRNTVWYYLMIGK